MSTRKVQIVTVDEDIILNVTDDITLDEVLRGKKIPPGLFQGYLKDAEELTPTPLTTIIRDIPHHKDIVLRCTRNTDFKDIIPQTIQTKRVRDPVTTFDDIFLSDFGCTAVRYEVNAESARDVIQERVTAFMAKYSISSTVVAGISGGGDSNTLVHALKNIPSPKRLLCYTIIFDPIWPASAAERATELCKKYDAEHIIYTPSTIEKEFNMKRPLAELYEKYCDKFGSNTSHFLGTYLISLIGRKVARNYGTSEYILGFNREDLLADILYSLINGLKPLPFPARSFGNIKLLMPLWEVPKKILDACYPKYSLSNYKERKKEGSTYQRSLIYFLSHGVEDVYPNLGLSLMHGIRKLFDGDWATLTKDDYDIFASQYADQDEVKEVKSFFSTYFV